MHLLCLGLNHKTASVSLRERLSFSEEEIRAGLARLACGEEKSISEMVLLSTCNRTELYAVVSSLSFSPLERFLEDTRGVPRADFGAHLYRYEGKEVAAHLFRVAAGLDSLVIGEPQILGQVTRALELARGQNAAGAILSRLFEQAIHAGKRARTETRISRNPASVSSLAAKLAENALGSVEDAQIVILGAGEMAELAVEALRKRGAQKILVVNRTLDRARSLAARWGADIATFEQIERALFTADIFISATGAPHTLVSPRLLAPIARNRSRALVMIDIAVPRDIDPACSDLPNIYLYDIDSLNTQLHESLSLREKEAPLVEAILSEEEKSFAEYLQTLQVRPLIADLSAYAERVRQRELEKTLRRLPDLNEEERRKIEKMTQALVKKLLAPPIQRLRAEAAHPHAPEYAAVARTLFGLEG